MKTPFADVARRAATRLAHELDPRLTALTEAELTKAERSDAGPDRYLVDPVSIASLVVSIAALTWQIYQDLKKDGKTPSADAIARRVRVTVVETPGVAVATRDRVIDVVVEELEPSK